MKHIFCLKPVHQAGRGELRTNFMETPGQMDIRFKFLTHTVFALLMPVLMIFVSPSQGKSQDIVDKLLPNRGAPKNLFINPEQRESIIKKLITVQSTAHAQRAQRVAFLLAALNVEYDRNRDYLLHALSGCNYPDIRYSCDDMTGDYLIYLYEHGHEEILAPLLKTSIGSYNAAGSEGLGAFFGVLVQKSPEKFLETVSEFSVPMQKKACGFAGASDGGGLGAKGLAQVRKRLRAIGSDVSARCLREIEDTNRPN